MGLYLLELISMRLYWVQPLNVAFYIFIQQIQVLNILNMVYTLRFFSSKCSLFHNSNVFGSSVIYILYTGVLKLKKNNTGAKRSDECTSHETTACTEIATSNFISFLGFRTKSMILTLVLLLFSGKRRSLI